MIPNKQKIKESYERATSEIKDFILSEKSNSIFSNIREAYKLHLDDAEKLSLAINGTLLGLTSIENFPSLIKEALPNQSEQERAEILKKINEDIFSVLRKKEEEKVSKIETAEDSLEKERIDEQRMPIKIPEKLEAETNSNADEFEVKVDEPEEKTIYKSSPDPYREPID